ncbi:RNA-guided endonuclease IscB [Nocardiopsis sp. Huas11]|uniref:RNA-guided endonuclease IscB n=1 Tax=Nocardiopsis sp. Huas11 TaxID=2183912 RepID=UPI000EB08B4C|nr:RNA-guided endonuclease IscB [Nocardiopsis sp. Huas11]
MFVLDKRGAPLQPCHPARARKLLAKGRAVVHRHTPFVIRLKDRTIEGSEVDGVELGIDPGSRHTGIAVFTHRGGERRGRYAIQLDHRGAAIRKKLAQRSGYRRRRRTSNLRYRPPRFGNRARPRGWLPPSLQHRVDTPVSWVDRLTGWAPVGAVHVERVAFDTHALSVDGPLEGVGYQQGTLHGYEVREYLLAKFGRACAYCGATNAPLNGRTKWNRTRNRLPKSHTLDALCVGKAEEVAQTVSTVLVAGCSGRGTYARTRPDKYGFPRLRLPRTKRFFGFATGDLVRAVVPKGKKAGIHTGRVAVRASGSFNITTAHGTVQGINRRHLRLLQRADGYAYTIREEKGVSRP